VSLLAFGHAAAAAEPVTTNEQDEDYQTVRVKSSSWASQRGTFDARIKRELLEASPRLQASELLSAAPGFFADHEDGEGLGNDVLVRGFDLEHGSGIEMRVGSIPINVPNHVRGQGYADPSFLMPEVVRSLRVLSGPFDPRQGDAAIAGSAYFDLGVDERGYRVKSSFGSFGQTRLVGIAAPASEDTETFSAVAVRGTRGFGARRQSRSGTALTQVGFDLGTRDHVRVLASAYGADASRPGVVRLDDVDAGRIGFYDAYPSRAEGQGLRSSRLLVGLDLDHVAEGGGRLEVAPWAAFTDFRARQNFAGALETSQERPALSGLGDLFETTNRETAAGLSSRFRPLPIRRSIVEVALEPGVFVRYGHTQQSKSLLVPSSLVPWDRRTRWSFETFDGGGYLDVDLRIARRLRISGGPRADLIVASIGDQAPVGMAASPRATVSLDAPVSPSLSYGEGFRSIDAQTLAAGRKPFSKVRSIEAGTQARVGPTTVSAALFQTWVENELVFEAEVGGLETQRASTRRGFIGAVVTKPFAWLLASVNVTVVDASYRTRRSGSARFVPNVPPVLARADVSARGTIAKLRDAPLIGRIGVGYTFASARRLTDVVRSSQSNILNAGVSVRRRDVELGVDAYNVLDLAYADEASVYASNWDRTLASVATHVTAAAPRTVLATASVWF
jgi:iron complex outermembrane recepter protein